MPSRRAREPAVAGTALDSVPGVARRRPCRDRRTSSHVVDRGRQRRARHADAPGLPARRRSQTRRLARWIGVTDHPVEGAGFRGSSRPGTHPARSGRARRPRPHRRRRYVGTEPAPWSCWAAARSRMELCRDNGLTSSSRRRIEGSTGPGSSARPSLSPPGRVSSTRGFEGAVTNRKDCPGPGSGVGRSPARPMTIRLVEDHEVVSRPSGHGEPVLRPSSVADLYRSRRLKPLSSGQTWAMRKASTRPGSEISGDRTRASCGAQAAPRTAAGDAAEPTRTDPGSMRAGRATRRAGAAYRPQPPRRMSGCIARSSRPAG